MKLWSIGIRTDAPDFERQKQRLLQAAIKLRAFGPGTLVGTKGEYHNVIFACDTEHVDEMLLKIRTHMTADGEGDVEVYGREILRLMDWVGVAEVLGVDADALEAMAELTYVDTCAPRPSQKPGLGNRLGVRVEVEGIDDAIRLLKILEAQLRGVQASAQKIAQAIDDLNLKLESRVRDLGYLNE